MLGRLIYFEVHVMGLLQLLILESFSKSLSYSVVLFFVDKLNVALGKNLKKKNLMDSCITTLCNIWQFVIFCYCFNFQIVCY